MHRLNGLLSAATVALAGMLVVSAPQAADLLRYAPVPEPIVASDPVEGWYLRLDATVSHPGRPKDATRPDPADPGLPPLVGLRLGNEAGYGGGVGYRVNGWLRVDATFDQRTPARFRTYSSRSNFVTGYNIEAGDIDVLTGFANVYADLGIWWGLTPYLGGGLGFADTAFRRNYTQTTCILDACDGAEGTGARTPVTRPNHSLPSFAWNLTAGVSYRIIDGFSLDAAYRYVDLGAAKSGADSYGGSTRLKDLTASEVRVGLRYQFAGGLLPVASQNPYGN